MKILLLGGSIFLGRHLVQSALACGHEVTLFNRGKSNPELFSNLEKLRGDRDGDLAALEGRTWDAVIDTCGYAPRIVRLSAEMLSKFVGRYVFISTISVYDDFSKPGLNEKSSLGILEDESVEEVTGETYGPLKALCEQVAEKVMPGRVLTIRPGLIAGPFDPTDRFTYWPARLARGGEVLVPNRPELPVQLIDVRDLSEWIISLIETGRNGVFNATGPDYSLTFKEMIGTCQRETAAKATLTWVDEEHLLDARVEQWTEVPLWISDPELAGLMSVNVSKALSAGLTFRPLAETVRDTLAWAQRRPLDQEWRGGLDPQKERALLSEWHVRVNSRD